MGSCENGGVYLLQTDARFLPEPDMVQRYPVDPARVGNVVEEVRNVRCRAVGIFIGRSG